MGKSPFAKPEVRTYEYPSPLDAPKRDEEGQALYESRTNSIDSEEVGEGHWIKIRIPRSRGDVDAVADMTQSMVILDENSSGPKFEQQIAKANAHLFSLLVAEWSFDVPVTETNYGRLDTWSGEWITACLADAVRRGTNRDFAKKTSPSSAEQESSEPKPSEPQAAE